MRPRVLLLEPIADTALALLAAGADVELAASPADADAAAAAAAAPVHAIMTRGRGRVTDTLIDACDGLRVVARCGVGLDNIDVAAASRRGIPVLNLPGVNTQTIAEHAVMLMLAVTRGLVDSAVAVQRGEWGRRASYERDELCGKTVGMIGFGNIGRRAGAMCRALGLEVVYADPKVVDTSFRRLDLTELCRTADVISVHCQLDLATRGLVDAALFEIMKPGVILINTARGAIIDGAALLHAVETGRLGGFGADVVDPLDEGFIARLTAWPNVVITPHVGSLTRSTFEMLCERSVRNVLTLLRGETLEARVVANRGELEAASR